MKIPSRPFHVARNLLAQRFDGRKLDLFPHAFEERDLDLGLRAELNWMEIQ